MLGTTHSLRVALIALSLSACSVSQNPADSATKNKDFSKVIVKAVTKPFLRELASKPTAPYIEPEPEKMYPPLSHLAGMSRFQVFELLGKPGFQRQDNPALFWQYRTESCALNLFLYRSGKRSQYKVNHFEIHPRKKNSVVDKDCFIILLKAHEKRSSG